LNRHLRSIALTVALAYAAPTLAQSFEGLDVSSDSKPSKKKRKKSSSKRRHGKHTEEAAPAPAPEPAPTGETSLKAVPPATETKPAPATSPSTTTGTAAAPSKPAPAATGLGLDLSGGNGAPATAAKPGNSSGGLGLDLTGNEKKGPQQAPVMSFDAVDVSGKSAERQKLDAAIDLFKRDQYEQAALSAWDIMNDPKYAGLKVEAQYVLGKSLYRLGMYHSSLAEFSQMLAHGEDTKYFGTGLEWLFFISHKTVNETVILDQIARYSNFEFPDQFKDEFHYLLARYYFVRGSALDQIDQKPDADKSFGEVKRLTLTLPNASQFYVRAKYLEGLAYFREGDFNASLADMKEVVKLTRPGSAGGLPDAKANKDLRELAFMQLARIHYGVRQNRYALYYYDKIDRGDPQWLEALFEGAWANYRVGQYEQALGNLITLSSPFFRDEYFPEAMILKAVIYYENCRYRESNAILSDFEKTYLPVHDELDGILKKDMDAAGYYDVLADIQRKAKSGKDLTATDRTLEKILNLALTDKDLSHTNDSILELENELDIFGQRGDTFKYSDLSKHLQEELKQERQGLVTKAGQMAKAKLESELTQLKTLLGNGLRIRFETTTKEKEFLEEQLRAGGKRELVKNYKYSVAVADDELYWPYEGEYWRDELGTYQYTLTKGCIDKSQRGGDQTEASTSP
jgi:hypothetical protein